MTPNVRIARGTIPVVLSVPHAVPHLRPGYSGRFPKSAEENSDLLAHRLRARTGASVIIAQDGPIPDPNWYADVPYKVALADLLRDTRAILLLDLHGSPATRVAGIEYDYDDSVDANRVHELFLLNTFRQKGFTDSDVRRYDAHIRHPETVASFASQRFGIPAYQVEVVPTLRKSDSKGHGALLEALTRFILEMSA